MLVVYMIFDIIVFENLRFGASKRKWEAGVFKNLHSEERFCKAAFSVTVFTRYVWTGPSFQMYNYRHQNSKIGFNACNKTGVKGEQSCNRTLIVVRQNESFHSRALSKSQNWPADHGLTNHFDHEIGFLQEFLLKKSSPLYAPCRIWQIWLDGLNQFNDFLTQQGNLTCHQSGNRKYHSTETLSLVVTGRITFSKQWTRRR